MPEWGWASPRWAAPTAQALPGRAAATGASVAVLGACLLARMVADGIDALGWLRWAGPFGLLAQTRPYAGDHPAPLPPLAAAAVVFGAAAVLAARTRDAGEGLLPVRTARRPRTFLLGSVVGFALRRAVGPLVGCGRWRAAVLAACRGARQSVSQFLGETPPFTRSSPLPPGLGGLGSVAGYAAAMFGLLSIPAGCYAAVRLAAAAADETSGRVVLLAAQPVSRARTAAAEITVAGTGVVVVLTAGALATWAGTAAVGAPLTLGRRGRGGVQRAARRPAVHRRGDAGLGCAARARRGHRIAAGGRRFPAPGARPEPDAPAWIGELSPYAHLAPVPDSPPDWAATATLTGVAVALAAAGVLSYTRRDLSI